jgi:hypothetical protein
MKKGESGSDAVRMGLALGAAVEAVIMSGRQASDQSKRDLAMAIAMGILHGCCGPNGDFLSAHRPPLSTP